MKKAILVLLILTLGAGPSVAQTAAAIVSWATQFPILPISPDNLAHQFTKALHDVARLDAIPDSEQGMRDLARANLGYCRLGVILAIFPALERFQIYVIIKSGEITWAVEDSAISETFTAPTSAAVIARLTTWIKSLEGGE